MRIVLAPDSFKGSLTASEVCNAMAIGIENVVRDANIVKVPMADGGEGTVANLLTVLGGRLVEKTVSDPLGNPIKATFGILSDESTAIIEMASASGLTLIPCNRRDPRITTSIGTGELIKAALDEGCKRLIIGIGGSATNDGGTGMASALGYRFLDAQKIPLPPGGMALLNLAYIETSNIDQRIKTVETLVACDVTNPLTGVEGASLVYAPQKGADSRTAEALDQSLENLADHIKTDLGIEIREIPGGGAAGGMGAGLIAFLNGELKSGVTIIADLLGLADHIRHANLVITGEGRIDHQTLQGKTPYGVGKIAKRFNKPVLAIAGSLGPGAEELYHHVIDGMLPIIDQPMTEEEAMQNGHKLVVSATERLMRIYMAVRES